MNGVISVNKARVSGVDRCQTKTGDDRRVRLCPRALAVLKRHLLLRGRLKAAGKLKHQRLFFLETGEPFQTLHYPQVRWRKTLRSLNLRYRRPYMARQTSVSWNLMIGKNPLWVAKQHGHSIATMLRAYAAWEEGAAEVDVKANKRSLNKKTALLTADLAVDLPVAEVVSNPSAPASAPPAHFDIRINSLITHKKMETNPTDDELAGVAGLFGPAGLTPSGPSAAR
jgi:integrase